MKLFRRQERIGGFIGCYGLAEWWLSTFSPEERRRMVERYTPMGLPAGTLTCGNPSPSGPATQFLSGLETWFRSKGDADILRRLHEKIRELGQESPVTGPGYYQGRHYTTYVEDAKQLKREGKTDALETLLFHLVAATEDESKPEGCGVAPWYYEELAKVFRSRRDYGAEIAILERFATQKHAPGVKPPLLVERLERARALAKTKKDTA